MSGMREFVTGSDACTTDGAGPSNAVAGLASTLLGTQSKARQQLQEYSGLGGQAPRRLGQAPSDVTPEAIVNRLAGGPQAHGFPGLDIHSDPQFQEFNRIYNEQVANVQAGRLHPSELRGHMHAAPESAPPDQVLHSTLHTFMRTGHMRLPFQPQHAAPALALSMPDELRIRDRSTILARHLYSEQGTAFADQQVGVLLNSLGINAAALPARIHDVHNGAFDQAWQSGIPPEESAMRAAHEAAVLQQARQQQQATGNGWVGTELERGSACADDFSKMAHTARVNGHQGMDGLSADMARARLGDQAGPSSAWVSDFTQQQKPAAEQWVEDFSGVRSSLAAPGQDWANDFASGMQAATSQWADEFQETVAASSGAAGATAQEHSRRMVQVLAQDPSARFQNSDFLQFLSKMSQGEVSFRDGKLVDQNLETAANDWANEFAATAPAGPSAAQLANAQEDWAAQFSAMPGPTGFADAEAWAEDFQAMQDQQAIFEDAWTSVGQANSGGLASARGIATAYVFQGSNPFDGNADALEIAKTAFAQGSLTTAVLALEAVVKTNPGNAEAWRLLGTAHAENDDDKQAIAAMGRALQAAPNSLDVMLALGVSHVNELHEGEAVEYLMRWLHEHPVHKLSVQGMDAEAGGSALARAQAASRRASDASPGDADILTALGVTMHLACDYHGAATAFESALAVRPDDYSLWNKLGATLANSSRSEEAKAAYVQALKWKPNYMRAWTNMGISHANLGQYTDAARFYVKALRLNAGAQGVWTHLETALVLQGRGDLLPALEAADVDALAMELGVNE